MPHPFHLFGSDNRTKTRDSSDLRIVSTLDTQWGKPLFKAPYLPSPKQRLEDLNFSTNFRAKDWMHRGDAS